jgi:hypothetical protein
MRTKIHEIPGKLICEWDSEANAVIDTWTTYSVTLDEFKEAVLNRGVNYAKNNGVKAWIVDSHSAKGVFSQEIQEFIGSTIFPTFAKIGVKYFMTINSDNAITNLTISQYSTSAGPHGLKVLTGPNAEGAIEWLKKNATLKPVNV